MSDQDGGESVPASALSPHLVTTIEELDAGVRTLLQRPAFVVDVETDGRRPVENDVTWIGLAADGVRMLIPMGHPNGEQLTPPMTVEVPDLSTVRPYKNDPTKMTKPKMRKQHRPATFTEPPEQLRPDVVIDAVRPLFFGGPAVVGHNLKYDIMSLTKYFGELPDGPYVDTLVLQHVLDETLSSYSLKNLTAAWALGKAAKNPEVRKKFYPELGKGGINNFAMSAVAEYLNKDISYTWWMFNRLRPQLKRNDLEEAFALEMDLYPVLMEMELTGIAIDTEVLKELSKRVHEEIYRCEQTMYAEAGRQFTISRPTDKKEVLFKPKSEGGQGLKPLSYTPKTGQPQVDRKFLDEYRDKNVLVGAMADHSELEKLRSTFVDKFLEEGLLVNGRVHGSLNQHRAETGRLSSSDPNLQQIPARTELGREFRKAFVPTTGYTMFVADYSQIELRCAAHLSKDPELTRVLVEGEDLHTAAASAAFGVPADEVTSEQRAVGKTMNFLILYGGGSKRLASQIGGSKDNAQKLIDNYFDVYNKLPRWKDRIVSDAWEYGQTFGVPTTHIPPYQRQRRVPELFSDDSMVIFRSQRQLVNSVVQGFAANIMKMALIVIHENLKRFDDRARLLLTVHDEVIGEVEHDIAEFVFREVLDDMESITYPDGTPILGKIPLVAEGGLGDNWVESK